MTVLSGLAGWAGLTGCALQQVIHKNRVGVEWRHQGRGATNDERYNIEQGIELKWDRDIRTGVTVRRRDVNDGNGDNDTGLFLELAYPLWTAPKKADGRDARISELERRLAELEARMSETGTNKSSS